jgi:RimJ/RimL family protein N-acetyltransferase
LVDADTLLWIAEQGGEAVGQVRVDRDGGIGTVSIAVAPDHRGRGFAAAMLRAMLVEVVRNGIVGELEARVHPDNTPSARAFESVGFTPTGERQAGFLILRLQMGARPAMGA